MTMQFQRFEDRVQLRLESGEHVAATLVDWLTAQDIGYAAMTGLGAVRSATVSYWNAETKQYESHDLHDQMEVVSLVGNVTIKEGKPFPHIHVALGRRDLSLVGGHFNDAIVHPTLELWLRPESEPVHRALDEACGLYVMQLPERP
jgi:predicted DNA-binding protein with PD1-like motif